MYVPKIEYGWDSIMCVYDHVVIDEGLDLIFKNYLITYDIALMHFLEISSSGLLHYGGKKIVATCKK